MKTETKSKHYQLKGNLVVRVPIPVIGNLIYDELGQEVLALHNEKFKGISRIEDTNKYEQGQPISYSNVPRVLSYNQILRERFPDMHVLSSEEVVKYWDSIPERDSTYADTSSVSVYPNEGLNEDLRKRVLDILKKPKTKLPLIVSGLGVEKSNNSYGFTFTETPYTKAVEAPYLSKNGKISFNGKEIVSSEDGINICIPSDQSGLRGLYRDRSRELLARDDDLVNSGESGRVQVVRDSQGRNENLEAKLTSLQEERDKQIAEINARYEKASGYLRSGKF